MHWFDDYIKRLLILLVGGAIVAIVAITLLKPSSWGEYGNYRGDALTDEATKPLMYASNESCFSCHQEVNEISRTDVHKKISCEMCHTPFASHVKNGKKIKDAVVVSEDKQNELCMLCHKKVVGREGDFPVLDAKLHLEELGVKPTHTCDQCHTVHAPMENVNYVKKLREAREQKAAKRLEELEEAREIEMIDRLERLEKAKDSNES